MKTLLDHHNVQILVVISIYQIIYISKKFSKFHHLLYCLVCITFPSLLAPLRRHFSLNRPLHQTLLSNKMHSQKKTIFFVETPSPKKNYFLSMKAPNCSLSLFYLLHVMRIANPEKYYCHTDSEELNIILLPKYIT